MRSALSFAFALAFSLLVPIRLAGQVEEPAVQTSDIYVPVCGTTIGFEGIEWRTALDIRNDLPHAALVVLTLVGYPDQTPFFILEPGNAISFSDVSRELFGMTGVLAPLRIQTEGDRPVSVSARAYGFKEGRFTEAQILTLIYGLPVRQRQTLPSLAFTEKHRSNVGLVNLRPISALFTLGAQRLPGRNVATATVIVRPWSLVHVPIQMLFPLVEKAEQITVVVDLAGQGAYAYASVIDNETNRAVFLPALGF